MGGRLHAKRESKANSARRLFSGRALFLRGVRPRSAAERNTRSGRKISCPEGPRALTRPADPPSSGGAFSDFRRNRSGSPADPDTEQNPALRVAALDLSGRRFSVPFWATPLDCRAQVRSGCSHFHPENVGLRRLLRRDFDSLEDSSPINSSEGLPSRFIFDSPPNKRRDRVQVARSTGARIFRQIKSACFLPREGCWATSSHTWSASQTGTPPFRTTERNTDSSFRGTRI